MSKYAYCGIDCEACPAYQITQENNPEKIDAMIKKWSEEFKKTLTPNDVLCDGCTSEGRVNGYWADCEIRQCAQDKGHVHCAACDGYACEKLLTFLEKAPDAKENLKKLKEQ